jgi:NDP-sugar pyrophosphorylase family protein
MMPPVAILAGGLSTRMRPVTERVPKALLQVAGKPFAVHQIDLLRRNGITDLVFCVGHLGELIVEAIGDGAEFGVRVRYSFDGPRLLGTAGALVRALPYLGERFFTLYGDAYLDCDYAAVVARFDESGAPGLMTVFRNADRWDRSNVEFVNGSIVAYEKDQRSPRMEYIDYGLGMLTSAALQSYPVGQVLDLATVYRDLVAKHQLAGFEVPNRFYEVGSPSGLEETHRYLERSR